MRRTLIPIMMGVGLVGVGVALGLVYLDVRNIEVARLELQADGGKANPDSDDVIGASSFGLVLIALGVGPISAALCGASVLMLLLECTLFGGGRAEGESTQC